MLRGRTRRDERARRAGGGLRGRAAERLELCPGGEDLFAGGGLAELDADALGVAVDDGDAVAVRADLGVEQAGTLLCRLTAAEQLADFFLQLFFFVLDERDDVAEDVERSDAGIARAGDGLHGGDEELLDAEALFERLRAARTRPMAQQLGLVTM